MAGQDAYPTESEKVAAFVYFMTKSHACWTGMKRITAALVLALLDHNDCWLATDPDEFADLITRVSASEGNVYRATIAQASFWFVQHLDCQHKEFLVLNAV